MVALSFWLLTLVCCGYGALYGGKYARAIALAYVLACLATLVAHMVERDWGTTHIPTLVVDLALLGYLLRVALSTRRWFPIWFTGLHLAAIASHFAGWLVRGFAIEVYFLLQSFWSVPMLILFAVGIELDRRKGINDDPNHPQDPAPLD